ncbi:ABC transporter substrate-binding protein [Leifsonia naganoensis]|uniref:Multiple sugar transport system substrate-binding protein n=1 Tax=Leifsonia naganoensis TaxID=150025 RepID=A0A853DJM1_9MICO|nr:sugar ABC transporter substrate-binding protein [Leifsonia naganoensis]NYK09412.1 multiple sugar transport system substrate-binding protein [Leifsonia naganoensis]
MINHSRWRLGAKKLVVAATVGLAVTAGLAGCSGASSSAGDTPSASVTQAQIDAAMKKKTTITIWTWATTLGGIVDAFEKKYPDITVNVVNVGTGAAHYQKLENAIKAGSGAPDLATVEYQTIPQFALEGSLVDLNTFGYGKYKDLFTPAIWNSTNVNGGLYELPHNAGPTAMFYNKSVFDKYGLDAPTTWAEYAADAKTIHEADPTAYIAADTGDAGMVSSMLWQAGAKPFQVSGTSDVSIDFSGAAEKKFTDFYQPLLDDKLLMPASGFSNDWYQGLANGKIATVVSGAWMAGSLKSSVPTGAGQWRVAPMPQYEAGKTASAMNGGGGYAMLKQSPKQRQLVAAEFLKFMETDSQAIQLSIAAGQFPATVKEQNSSEFLEAKNDYFGGQQINTIFSQSAADALKGWQYLPYQSYANSVFSDTAGQAWVGKTTLQDGLKAWGDKLVTYGKQQGFTVK